MIVAFTGTRFALTLKQTRALKSLLDQLGLNEQDTVLHGCCTGADTEFHKMCREKKVRIIGYPAYTEQEKLADECDSRHGISYDPLVRNRQMVNGADLVIGAPNTMKDQIRSGTWMTLRHCKKRRKNHHIVYPDGQVESLHY